MALCFLIRPNDAWHSEFHLLAQAYKSLAAGLGVQPELRREIDSIATGVDGGLAFKLLALVQYISHSTL